MFGDADLGVFFADFGKETAVTFSGVTVPGILDQPESVHLGDRGFGGINATLPVVRLPYNAFSPMPKNTDRLVVAGQAYTVTERTAESDGAILAYSLKKAS